MKKIAIGAVGLLMLLVVSITPAFAYTSCKEDRSAGFSGFKVIRCNGATSMTVFTVEGGKRGYVILNGDASLEQAKELAKTKPDTNLGTKGNTFAIRRA